MKRVLRTWAAATLCLAAAPGCSRAQEPSSEEQRSSRLAAAKGVPAQAEAAAADVSAASKSRSEQQAESMILGKKDIALRGKPACEVRFQYAGREPENLFWEEPCADVTAKMMTQAELEELNKWERLDEFDRKFVDALPGGKVLYVEGSFSASVYPVGTTGETYERSVAD